MSAIEISEFYKKDVRIERTERSQLVEQLCKIDSPPQKFGIIQVVMKVLRAK